MPRIGRMSLAARTALVMLTVLAVVQAFGLALHSREQSHAERVLADRTIGMHVMGAYRSILETPAVLRPAEIARLSAQPSFTALRIDPFPAIDLSQPGMAIDRDLRLDLNLVPVPRRQRPLSIRIAEKPRSPKLTVVLELADGSGWLTVSARRPSPGPFAEPTFLAAWLLMTATAAVLIVWATRLLTRPLHLLAAAADALGRDVNAPPLVETGPREIAGAAIAFNTMASRIRRFVSDRTFLLTAIGHDLRTPITRLKLRCEFIDDDDIRTRFLADLDELEQMVASTLAFGRDTARAEPAAPLDLAALLRTVADEAADARPEMASRIAIELPARHVALRGRPLALKRSFANLVGNALAYAGGATISLAPATAGEVAVLIDDDGPGIPADEIERVFEPFRRLETSRSRETGGTGLGLSIARNIVRAHGGEITLSNRPAGGLRARVVLPL